MGIEKFLSIANIGRFADYVPHGQCHFDKLTLVYGENAKGKTTLAAILRSLAENKPAYITERARLGATDSPHVEVRLAGRSATFRDGAWDRYFPDVMVFDDEFVCRNVYAGLMVSLDQRRNLQRIIIGAQGVQLARRVVAVDRDSRQKAREKQESRATIQPSVRGQMSVEDFCALPAQPNVDDAIESKRRELSAAQNAHAVRATQEFAAIRLPPYNFDELRDLLRRSVEDLNTAAAEAVQAHFANLGEGAEEWIAEGVPRIVDGNCPFCGKDVSTVDLVTHFRVYFSDAYKNLRAAVSQARSNLQRMFGGDALADFQQSVNAQHDLKRSWARFVRVPDNEFPVEEIRQAWTSLRDELTTVLAQKAAHPLEASELSEAAESAITAYQESARRVSAVATALIGANTAITRAKTAAGTADANAIQTELYRLENTKARHTDPLAQQCQDYLSLEAAKARIEADRAEAKARLDEYTEAVFPQYQKAINRHLHQFNVSFRVAGLERDLSGGRPGSRYHVRVNEERVDLGGDDTPYGTPCFRNTLSAGDRTALALAFFLAQVDQDPNLADKTIVFDDPIASFDGHRRTATQQTICRLTERAAQVVVMSHFAPFLRSIWDHADNPPCNPLKVTLTGSGSVIEAWDIESDVLSDYHKCCALLLDYWGHRRGETREVAHAIRPFLEGYLRAAFPDVLGPNDRIGKFLADARQAQEDGSPLLAEDERHDLEDMNEYALRYHHNTNRDWQTERIDTDELHGFVGRALDFMRKGRTS